MRRDLAAVAADEANLRPVHDWLVSIDARPKLRPQRRFGPRQRWRMLEEANAALVTSRGQIDVVERIERMPAFERPVSESEVFQRERMDVTVRGAIR